MNIPAKSIVPVATVLAVLLSLPAAAPAQSPSKLSPLIRNPSATSLGPTQRMSRERIDLSTVTREDRDILQGREQRMGESVTTVRRFREGPATQTVSPTRPQVDLDREKVRRAVTVLDD